MRRVTTAMNNNDLQFYLRRREGEINKTQMGMASQNRIRNLRDDPIGAAHASRYQSSIKRMNRFSKNIEQVQSQHQIAEGYLMQAQSIMQRVRELAIQGGNSTYTREDKAAMAVEVNELLNELVSLGNAGDADGMSLFAGIQSQNQSFRSLEGHVDGLSGNVITQVEYTGSAQTALVEVSEGTYVENGFAGNEVFWAENQQVYSTINADNYHVPADTEIKIDNISIPLKAGDNVETIISRINSSFAAVKAGLDPVQNSLRIETTTPHQIWLSDGETGNVLSELGILSEGGGRPPENFSSDARVYGGSLFDMVINLRDELAAGDTEAIGGAGLRGIDQGMERLRLSLTRLGARDERLSTTATRLKDEIPTLTSRYAGVVDVDMTEAITELNQLNYVQQAALKTAGSVLEPSLLNYLR